MPSRPSFALSLWLIVLTILFPGLLRAEPDRAAAQVVFASGTATVRDKAPGSPPAPLTRGISLHEEQVISTGSDGRAQLRFSDGATLSLNADSEFAIDRYRFAPERPEEAQGFFSLIKGGLRTITGLIGKARRENYRMNTVVATIGIRGTDYSINYLPGGGISVTTHGGQVEVCNNGGCVLVGPGENARVPNADARPQLGVGPQINLQVPTVTGDGGFSAAGEKRDGSGSAGSLGNGPQPPAPPPSSPNLPSTSPNTGSPSTYMPRGQ